MSSTVTDRIAANLKRHRLAAGLTQEQLARKAGVVVRSYNNWERGVRRPQIETVVALAGALGVSCDQLLDGVHREPK